MWDASWEPTFYVHVLRFAWYVLQITYDVIRFCFARYVLHPTPYVQYLMCTLTLYSLYRIRFACCVACSTFTFRVSVSLFMFMIYIIRLRFTVAFRVYALNSRFKVLVSRLGIRMLFTILNPSVRTGLPYHVQRERNTCAYILDVTCHREAYNANATRKP